MKIITVTKNDFTITTDKIKLNLNVIHNFLANESSWSKNIPFEKVKSCIENSLNFGLFHKENQIGYARVISDYTTIAYLGDVFVVSNYRGQGLSKWLMEQVMAHPNLQGLRRWVLCTADAHELYKKYGWTSLAKPELYMERWHPNVYNTLSQ
jgi:N-acetylglutamate synthase-like GNAT family acetyltransferase